MTLIRIANYFNVSIDYLLDMPVGMPTVSGNRKISPDLHELIALYSELTDYEKGRVLQFVIDLHKKE